MILPELQVVAQVFAERILNTAIEGMILVGVVWLLLRIIDGQNSRTRFVIWLAALVAVVALPFVSGSRISGVGSLASANLSWKLNLSSSWAYYLFGAWSIGAGMSMVGLIAGLWRLRELRSQCDEVDLASMDRQVAGLLRDFKLRRAVKLCVSRDVSAPAAIGFFRPAIVFPAGLLSQLCAEEIKVILLHELAHLRRWDDWTNLIQKIAKALLFFHPAVWWIESRLTLEREMACDDIVLAATSSPRAYASSLISFAEKLRDVRGVALAQSLLSRVCQMSLRVAHILDAKRPSSDGLWKPVLGVSTALLVLIFGAAPYAPRVVAFEPQSHLGLTQVQPQQASTNRAATAVVTDVIKNRDEVGKAAVSRSVSPQPRAIQAAYHPGKMAASPRLKKISPSAPLVVHTRAVQDDISVPPTFLILQTTRFDASGSGVWTLCVWRIGGTDQAERQWASTIVVSVI